MLRAPLTQAVLDGLGCSNPDCGHDHSTLWLHGECHPEAGLEVAYVKARGCLVCTCTECDHVIAVVEVARGGSLN